MADPDKCWNCGVDIPQKEWQPAIPNCLHRRTISTDGDETFMARVGCLDCNQWLDPVRFKNRRWF